MTDCVSQESNTGSRFVIAPATIASIIHEVWYRYRDSLYGKALGVGTGGGGSTGGACVTCGVVSRGGGVPGARVGAVTGDAG